MFVKIKIYFNPLWPDSARLEYFKAGCAHTSGPTLIGTAIFIFLLRYVPEVIIKCLDCFNYIFCYKIINVMIVF